MRRACGVFWPRVASRPRRGQAGSRLLWRRRLAHTSGDDLVPEFAASEADGLTIHLGRQPIAAAEHARAPLVWAFWKPAPSILV